MGKKDKVAHVQPRHVAVSVPYRRSAEGIEVCLVSSRKHEDRWVLPKGGIEEGESEAEAAIRELHEEAGLQVGADAVKRTHNDLVADHKPHKKSPSEDPKSPVFVPRAIYTGVEILVHGDADSGNWPESDERRREWVSLSEAGNRIAWRKDIWLILTHCGFHGSE